MIHLLPLPEAICAYVMMVVALLGYLELRFAKRLQNRKAMLVIALVSLLEFPTLMIGHPAFVAGRIVISVIIFILSICIFRKLKDEAWSLHSHKWYCIIFWLLSAANGWISLQKFAELI